MKYFNLEDYKIFVMKEMINDLSVAAYNLS
jgi:hypothetical protein